MTTDAQSKLILEHLRTNGSITPMEALNLYGCMRLCARIYDLKAEGHNIITIMTIGKKASGRPSRYARYVLNEQSS